jgi:hypothetical protein
MDFVVYTLAVIVVVFILDWMRGWAKDSEE